MKPPRNDLPPWFYLTAMIGNLIFRLGYFVGAGWTIQRLAAAEGHEISLRTILVAGGLVVGALWILGPRRVT